MGFVKPTMSRRASTFCPARSSSPRPTLVSTALTLALSLSFLATPALGAALGKRNYEISTQRSISVMNESGRKFDVLWINTFRKDGQLEYRSNNEGVGYPHGGTANILSYIGHEFQVRELPGKKTGKCKGPDGECATGHFQVNDKEDQMVTVDSEFNVIHTDSRKRAKDQLAQVKEDCKKKFADDDTLSSLSFDDIVELTAKCLAEKIEEKLASQKEEVEFQSALRQRMGVDLLPHACKDPKAKTSGEVYNVTWTYQEDRTKASKRFQLKMLHERPTSRIATIENFATAQECRSIKNVIESLKKADDSPSTDASGNAPSLAASPPTAQSIPWSALEGNSIESFVFHNLAKRLNSLHEYLLPSPDRTDNPSLEALMATTAGRPFLELYEDDVQSFQASDCISTGDKDDQECRVSQSGNLASFHVDDPNEFAKVFLFCDAPETPDEEELKTQPFLREDYGGTGSLYFPQAGVYVTPKVSMAVVVTMWDKTKTNGNDVWDGYTQDFHMCPNHSVLVHNVARTQTSN